MKMRPEIDTYRSLFERWKAKKISQVKHWNNEDVVAGCSIGRKDVNEYFWYKHLQFKNFSDFRIYAQHKFRGAGVVLDVTEICNFIS